MRPHTTITVSDDNPVTISLRVSRIRNIHLRRAVIVLTYPLMIVLGLLLACVAGFLWFAAAQIALARSTVRVWNR
jgi:hypothetical protein